MKNKKLDLILKKLEDGKAQDILKLDLKGKTSLTDYLVIASGTSTRHVNALSVHLSEELKKMGASVRIDGKKGSAEWIVLDAGDVIVHLFHPETRAFYEIEEMWGAKTPGQKEEKCDRPFRF